MRTKHKVLIKIFGALFIVVFNSVTKDTNYTLVLMLQGAFGLLLIIIIMSLIIDAIQTYRHREKVRE